MSLLRCFVATGRGVDKLKKAIEDIPDNTVISLESLNSWNPDFWQDSLLNNIQIFPKNSTVLITLREPTSYLTSVYVQGLHEGNIIKPEEYFLDDDSYKASTKIMNGKLAQVFKVDGLDYFDLVSSYSKEFREVVVVSMESLLSLDFFKGYLNLTDTCIIELKELLKKAKIENVSYSCRAVRLTFLRETVLNYFGLRSMSSQDVLRNRYLIVKNKKSVNVFNRFLTGLKKYLQWRYFMQNVFDKIVPYKKYKLPDNIHKGVKFESNTEYYEMLKSCGYKVYSNEYNLE